MIEPSHPIVLYDGVCNVCDASVQFILDHDSKGLFRFASLQSDVGHALASSVGIDAADMNTLVLISNGKGTSRSDAVIEIARRLGHPWAVVGVFLAFPRPMRDLVYQIVAMNRIHWFGRRDACRIPAPNLRNRFLDL